MEYLELIDLYRDEMVETLQDLVRINSVRTAEEIDSERGKLPFGRGVDEAFQYMLKMAEKDGFETKNVDNYGGHIDFGGYKLDEAGDKVPASQEIMGIAAHLDVVPVGEGWKHGDPFSATLEEGWIYGRGTQDDKGPLVSAYYAMKALKAAGFIPSKKVRLILGLDEETEWQGVEKYFLSERMPDFGFTPDGYFPLINGEMGILVFRLAKKFAKNVNKGLELRSLKAGKAPNMVPDYARAVVRSDKPQAYEDIKELAALYREETGHKVSVKGTGKSLEIVVTGKAAHGAHPWEGLNAISIIFEFLGKLNFVSDDVNEFIEFYNKHIGFNLNGENIGCDLEDEESGKLVFNVGLCEMGTNAGEITVNVRYPVTKEDFDVYDGMKTVLDEFNIGVIKLLNERPLYMAEDSPMVVKLMNAYKEMSGDTEAKPFVTGGGTYAKAFKNMLCFGAQFQERPDVMHQANERALVEDIVKASKIYAKAIYDLTRE